MALTDVALKNAPEGAILRENGLEFRFYAKGEAGVRFVGRVRGSGARVAIKLARIIHDSLRLVDCLPPFSAEANC